MGLKQLLPAVVLALAAQCAAGAAWTRAAWGGVEVHTDAGRGMAGRILAETLRFHAACARYYGLDPAPPPMSVVYFASESDFRQFRGDGYSKGFFQRQGDSTWIVVHAGADAVRRLRHEVVHVLNDQAGLSLAPAWLNEGLAEYWSAMDVNAAMNRQWRSAPIPALLELLSGSSGFRESDLGDGRQEVDQALFYARSWLLVRHLTADGGMDRIKRLGALLAGGEDSGTAFRLVYGAGVDTLIGRAQAAVGPGGAARGWVEQSWPPPHAAGETALGAFDSELLLGELASVTGSQSESQRRYEKALAAAGRGPDGHSRMAMVALRRGDRKEALRLMDAAARAGSMDARMWFEYAILLRDGEGGGEGWIRAARRAVELDPERAEAWFILGSALHGGDAVDALARAARSAQSRSWMWEAYGRALLKAGRKDEARAAAAEALKRARRPRERAMAEGLMADIDALAPPRKAAGPATVTPEGWKQRQGAASVEGRLVEVDCAGRVPVLVVDGPGGMARISVKQTAGLDLPDNMNFTCGPQSPRRPAIFGHDAQPDTALRSTGDLRSIRFK
ncbi:MAG: hypothetical protein C0504_01985 [Candidatus Solibacter sp.]|nr:hypothetical protein [Candidatus Solibacter sp.]